MGDPLGAAAAWLLTYLLHSTVLISGTWLILRLIQVRSLAWREALWTIALCGGLITATAQALSEIRPFSGRLLLPAFSALGSAHAGSAAGPGSETQPPPVRCAQADACASARCRILGADGEPASGACVEPALAVPVSGSDGPATSTLAGLAAVAALGLLLGAALRSGLGGPRDRRALAEGALPALLLRLRRESGVKQEVALTVSRSIASPVAFGLRKREICVPERALLDLTPEQQEGMLAHELAHLVRADPLRLLLCRLIEVVLFLQPLNRPARRRLFETVECRCDAWAIRLVGRGLPLAECLTKVAVWITEGARPVAAVAMAEEGSPLGRRVLRLLCEEEALAEDRRRRRSAPLLVLLLPALALLAPVVSTAAPAPAADEARPEAAASLVPEAPVSSDRALLVAEAVGLLEEEISLLRNEVAGLRAVIPRNTSLEELNDTLLEIEQRVDGLDRRLAVLAVWRRMVLREHGLDSPQPAETRTDSSPRRIE